MGKYSKSDAARETKTSTSKVSKAWHDARDDAQKAAKSGDSFVQRLTKDWKRGK